MSAETKIAGLIHKIMPVQEISNTFTKREIVVKTGGDYPQYLSIQFVQDQVFLFNDILEGANVVVDVNLRGREWTNPTTGEVKYFNTLQGWKIEQVNNTGSPAPKPAPKPMGNIESNFAEDAINELNAEHEDDLPF